MQGNLIDYISLIYGSMELLQFFSKSAVLFFELKKQPRSVNFHKVMYFSFWNKVSRKLEKLSLRKKTMYSIIGICFEKIDRFLISARCRNFFQSTNKQQKTLQHFVKIDIYLLIKHFFKLWLYSIDGKANVSPRMKMK